MSDEKSYGAFTREQIELLMNASITERPALQKRIEATKRHKTLTMFEQAKAAARGELIRKERW
jgi:hypothetical protein